MMYGELSWEAAQRVIAVAELNAGMPGQACLVLDAVRDEKERATTKEQDIERTR